MAARFLGGNLHHVDIADGGRFQLTFPPTKPVRKNGELFMTRIRIHDYLSGRLIREAWSDIVGEWLIDYIRYGRYYAICFDVGGDYEAIIYADVTPEAMP